MRLRRTAQRIRWWAVRLGLASATLLVTFAVLGLGAEAYLYLRNPDGYAQARTARSEIEDSVFDRRVGVCFAEGDALPFSMMPGRYEIADGATITINSRGYRGREFSATKPPNTLRILFLGDSFTYGFGVDDGETIPALVEGLLDERLFGDEGATVAGETGFSHEHSSEVVVRTADPTGETDVERTTRKTGVSPERSVRPSPYPLPAREGGVAENRYGDPAGAGIERVEVINAGFQGSSPMQYDLYLRTEGYALEPDLIVLVLYSGNDLEDLAYNVVEEVRDDGRPTRISNRLAFHEGRLFQTVLPGWVYMLPGLDRSAAWYSFNKRLYAAFEGPRQAVIDREAEMAFFSRPLAAMALDTQERSISLQAWIVVGREMLDPRWAGRGTQDYQDIWRILDRLGVETVDLAPMLMAQDVAEICFPNDLHLNARGNRLVAEAGVARLTERVVAIMGENQPPALAAGEEQ